MSTKTPSEFRPSIVRVPEGGDLTRNSVALEMTVSPLADHVRFDPTATKRSDPCGIVVVIENGALGVGIGAGVDREDEVVVQEPVFVELSQEETELSHCEEFDSQGGVAGSSHDGEIGTLHGVIGELSACDSFSWHFTIECSIYFHVPIGRIPRINVS